MMKGLRFKIGMVAVAVVLLLVAGVAYAVTIERSVSGVAAIGQAQSVDDTVLLWSDLGPPKTALTVVDFGTLDIDAFGNMQAPPLVQAFVENGGGTPFLLTVEARNIMVQPPGGAPAPSPARSESCSVQPVVR